MSSHALLVQRFFNKGLYCRLKFPQYVNIGLFISQGIVIEWRIAFSFSWKLPTLGILLGNTIDSRLLLYDIYICHNDDIYWGSIIFFNAVQLIAKLERLSMFSGKERVVSDSHPIDNLFKLGKLGICKDVKDFHRIDNSFKLGRFHRCIDVKESPPIFKYFNVWWDSVKELIESFDIWISLSFINFDNHVGMPFGSESAPQ